MHRFLLLHGGNPLNDLLFAAAHALFLIGGYNVIRMAPSPRATDERPAEEQLRASVDQDQGAPSPTA